ncbi:hypothetical protein FNV43_RR24196 [Rhamnella rubrinervis]|uniref:Uncharacterized protein n=1 Tax=Rhamnella rubrinervis TaxID=2594499 RepID=A0A8K0DRS9_9ROSA|nr:hypothetical protein FNV43_RR24196 [Rhamnella rubrinervis]
MIIGVRRRFKAFQWSLFWKKRSSISVADASAKLMLSFNSCFCVDELLVGSLPSDILDLGCSSVEIQLLLTITKSIKCARGKKGLKAEAEGARLGSGSFKTPTFSLGLGAIGGASSVKAIFLLQSDLESCVADSYSDLWDGLHSDEIRKRRLDSRKRLFQGATSLLVGSPVDI